MNLELENAVTRGVKKIGEQSLIRVLNDINNKMHFKPGLDFQFIETIICQYFTVSSNNLYGSDNDKNTVNCRKMISYMLLKHTDMENHSVCYLLQINSRTLRRYKQQMFNLLEIPNIDPELYKAYIYLDNILLTNKGNNNTIL